MEIKVESPIKIDKVKSIDKLMILLYNIILVAGASYLVIQHEFSAWIYVLVVILAGSWSEKDKE